MTFNTHTGIFRQILARVVPGGAEAVRPPYRSCGAAVSLLWPRSACCRHAAGRRLVARCGASWGGACPGGHPLVEAPGSTDIAIVCAPFGALIAMCLGTVGGCLSECRRPVSASARASVGRSVAPCLGRVCRPISASSRPGVAASVMENLDERHGCGRARRQWRTSPMSDRGGVAGSCGEPGSASAWKTRRLRARETRRRFSTKKNPYTTRDYPLYPPH